MKMNNNGTLIAKRENVLSLYSTSKINQQRNATKYYEAMKLRNEFGYGSMRISKIINMPMSAVHYWLQGFEPKSIKGIKELESIGLLPLRNSNSKAFRQFVRAFGLRYADGCVYEQKRNNSYTGYLCFGKENNAIQFAKDCEEAWNIKLKHHYGSRAYYVYLPASIVRLMIAAGSPVGNKTTQIFSLPKWIQELPESLKSEFLGGLFSGDAETPRLKKSGNSSESLRLSLSSEKGLAEEFANTFMLDVWKMLTELGIEATRPSVRFNEPRHSKNGKTTYPIAIRILTKKQNMINFLKKVKYRYSNRGIKAAETCLCALENKQ